MQPAFSREKYFMTTLSKDTPGKLTIDASSLTGTTAARGGRIVCPECGNDLLFYEVAEEVTLTTSYIQNPDGSFTPQHDDSRILGVVKLYCAECRHDLTQFHNRFVEMLF